MKSIAIFVLIFSILLSYPAFSHAADFSINNKFGIHLATPDDGDIDRARELVNSSGGNWGYVTLVIQENDRDVDKWQGIFDKLREKRLIPIIRLATAPVGDNWRRPSSSDADKWVTFLHDLNWVVQNRYIILFNEPNHATEWGGSVDPQSFAEVNEAFARKLKSANADYFVMLGGLDASAPSAPPRYESEDVFLREVVDTIGVSDMNTYFDGLASHSYPNPGFAGPANGNGRGSVRTYQWELSLLSQLGVKELPVFITETGWDGDALSRDEVAKRFQSAYENIWLPDTRVVAVTPFILNYQTEPFLKFSWVKPGNGEVNPEFTTVKDIRKRDGRPEIRQAGEFSFDLPQEIVEDSTYHFQIMLANEGQAIWDHDDQYEVVLEGIPKTQYIISSLSAIKPFNDRIFDIYLTTQTVTGENEVKFTLKHGRDMILQSKPWTFTVVPFPPLTFKASLFPKVITQGSDFELQVFDEYEQLVFSKKNIGVQKGVGEIDRIENIALGRKYRLVLLKPYYLPRQTYLSFKKGENEVKFEKMWPVDFNGDGTLTWGDVGALFGNLGLLGKLLF